jgi:hypothetical protein
MVAVRRHFERAQHLGAVATALRHGEAVQQRALGTSGSVIVTRASPIHAFSVPKYRSGFTWTNR